MRKDKKSLTGTRVPVRRADSLTQIGREGLLPESVSWHALSYSLLVFSAIDNLHLLFMILEIVRLYLLDGAALRRFQQLMEDVTF
jgi:hypothetical protein